MSAGRLCPTVAEVRRWIAAAEEAGETADGDRLLELRGILGDALAQAHQYAEAEELLVEVLVERERRYGPDDHRTQVARGNLSRCVRQAGRPAEALAIAEALLADRRRLLGPEHPSTLDAVGHVAHALCALGRYGEAVALFTEQGEARARVLGNDHWSTVQSRDNVLAVRARSREDDPEELLEALRQAAQDAVDRFGLLDEGAMAARGHLTDQLVRMGRWEDALVGLEILAADREVVLGPAHPMTLTTLRTRLGVLDALGRHQDLRVALGEFAARCDLGGDTDPTSTTVWNRWRLFELSLQFRATESVDDLVALASPLIHLWQDAVAVFEPGAAVRTQIEECCERLLTDEVLDTWEDRGGSWDRPIA